MDSNDGGHIDQSISDEALLSLNIPASTPKPMSISRFLSSYQFAPLTNNEVSHGSDSQKHISDEHFPQEIVPATQIAPNDDEHLNEDCLLYTSPSPRDQRGSRMPSSA